MSEAVIVCARVIEGGPIVVPGSIQRTCANCGVPVWIAPSAQGLLDGGARTLCGKCGMEAMKRDAAKAQPLTEWQVAELIELLRTGEWYQGKRGPFRVRHAADIQEAGERIGYGHPLARQFGFTPVRFEGWLWMEDGVIYISNIQSLQPMEGNLSRLISSILAAGFTVKVPAPFPVMRVILKNKGFQETMEYEPLAGEECEIWVKAP